jgi:hypothetical protein
LPRALCCWCYEAYSSSDPLHGRRHPYKEPSRSCSYEEPWSFTRSHSFLPSSSSLVLLCLLLPSGENPSKYGGEWLIPPYIGINPYISPAKSELCCFNKLVHQKSLVSHNVDTPIYVSPSALVLSIIINRRKHTVSGFLEADLASENGNAVGRHLHVPSSRAWRRQWHLICRHRCSIEKLTVVHCGMWTSVIRHWVQVWCLLGEHLKELRVDVKTRKSLVNVCMCSSLFIWCHNRWKTHRPHSLVPQPLGWFVDAFSSECSNVYQQINWVCVCICGVCVRVCVCVCVCVTVLSLFHVLALARAYVKETWRYTL